MKLKSILAAAVTGVAICTGMAAANWDSPYYYVEYYSDATLTEKVGQNVQTCTLWGQIVNNLTGQQTQYSTHDLIGYCQPGGNID